MKSPSAQYFFQYMALLPQVENPVARAAGISVSALRALLAVAALEKNGPPKYLDIIGTPHRREHDLKSGLFELRRRSPYLMLTGGVISGTYTITPEGRQLCDKYARLLHQGTSLFRKDPPYRQTAQGIKQGWSDRAPETQNPQRKQHWGLRILNRLRNTILRLTSNQKGPSC